MNKEKIIAELQRIIDEVAQISTTLDTIKEIGRFGKMTDDNFDFEKYIIWDTRCHNLLSRIMSGETIHYKRFKEEDNRGFAKPSRKGRGYFSHSVELYYKRAILIALRDDLVNDVFFDEKLLLTAENYQEILQQAEMLIKNDYKDPAAVLIGAVLEVSLRKICTKHRIEYRQKDTINPLNNLLKEKAYNSLTHKQIITWADLRNNAAHGHFDRYSASEVKMMYGWIVKFIEDQLHKNAV
ncbi:MAG: hypothetical protein HQ534_13055 [Armatimonadetes bacterium]|nr:hypothetical protein [Armatimonadota bacterium]